MRTVVLYLHSTSNHNSTQWQPAINWLYYIFILHQTTTKSVHQCIWEVLYYIFILHQTTTVPILDFLRSSCIISSFYIKPQLAYISYIMPIVVLYLHSTSNHNHRQKVLLPLRVVLYLHSTSNHNCSLAFSISVVVVLYLHSTSNHN